MNTNETLTTLLCEARAACNVINLSAHERARRTAEYLIDHGVYVSEPCKAVENAHSVNRGEVLESALRCVCHDRNAQYGEPEEGLSEIALLWSWWLGKEIASDDVAMMMALLKVGRIKTGGHKADNYIDGCGYLAIAAEITGKAGEG